MSETVVLKFGGSSLATPELREVAASRVLEQRGRGRDVVVVCSAMGRKPDAYATDALLALVPRIVEGPNRDLLLACGELISCAVFAETLAVLGHPARALTGGQAGISTDGRHGDAQILGVDPAPLRGLLDDGVIPVVAGFQGVASDGSITTLGRGGSDFTAIALGNALGAEAVEIYTDVAGVMTADPRRIAGAHTVPRVTQDEMVELASNGARVMHHKAAEMASTTKTPYAVKALRSGLGTAIDQDHEVDRAQPVTGIATIEPVAFFRAIQGLTDDESRAELDREIFARLATRGISIDMINVNDAGVFFICDEERLDDVRAELGNLNLALRVRPGCAKLSIVGAGMRGTSGVMLRVVEALTDAAVEIIHSTDSNITISILVPLDQVRTAEQAVHDAFGLAGGVRI